MKTLFTVAVAFAFAFVSFGSVASGAAPANTASTQPTALHKAHAEKQSSLHLVKQGKKKTTKRSGKRVRRSA